MPVARRLVTESRHFFAAVTVEADLRIGDAFTISAWTKGTAQRSPSGALLRKVPANNNSLTCWSAHVEGIWRYGEHDAGLLDNAPKTAFAPANGTVVQATGWVLVTFAYARDAVRNTQHLRYYVNDELVYSASLARPVTDCVGTLLMADKDVMLGTLTFIPRALSTGQIREMLREGQALREMVVGQRPQVHVPPSPPPTPRAQTHPLPVSNPQLLRHVPVRLVTPTHVGMCATPCHSRRSSLVYRNCLPQLGMQYRAGGHALCMDCSTKEQADHRDHEDVLGFGSEKLTSVSQILCAILFCVFNNLHGYTVGCAVAHLYHAKLVSHGC